RARVCECAHVRRRDVRPQERERDDGAAGRDRAPIPRRQPRAHHGDLRSPLTSERRAGGAAPSLRASSVGPTACANLAASSKRSRPPASAARTGPASETASRAPPAVSPPAAAAADTATPPGRTPPPSARHETGPREPGTAPATPP